MRTGWLLISLILLFYPVSAVSGEIIIDNFEDADISDWSMLWGDLTSDQQNFTLSVFPHSGSYSILLWDSREGPAVDFAKQDMNVSLDNPISYYNISFWYYAVTPCDYPTNNIKHRIYISDEPSFLFKAVRIDSGDIMSCGQWNYISQSIEDEMIELLGSFSLDSTSLESLMIETWHNGVYYDDIKLIPKLPEDIGGGCVSEWACGEWSECVEGIQSRSCVDSNDCDDDSTMPSNQQSCGAVLDIIEPEITTFYPGQTVTITVNVSYINGTIIPDIDLILSAFGLNLSMTETQPGIYSIILIPDENDIGIWEIGFSGFENLQFSRINLDVREVKIEEQNQTTFDLSGFFSSVISSLSNFTMPALYIIMVLLMIVALILIFRRKLFSKKPKRKKDRKEIKKEKPKKRDKKKPPKVKEDFDESDGLHEVKL